MEVLSMETCHFGSVFRLRLWSIDNIREKDKRANDPKKKIEAASPLASKWAPANSRIPIETVDELSSTVQKLRDPAPHHS
jgi:hypothetical protein